MKKVDDRISWPIIFARQATRQNFVMFWNQYYSGYDEDFYQQNIGKPLTEERIRKWFEWKNGRPLSPGKMKSIQRYLLHEERIIVNEDTDTLRAFLHRPGGAVWRIFWIHLQFPLRYPIYDQHVHRAMAYLRGWDKLDIPARNAAKVDMYLDEYRPFFLQFDDLPQRSVDRALWAFGKYLATALIGVLRGNICIDTPTRTTFDT